MDPIPDRWLAGVLGGGWLGGRGGGTVFDAEGCGVCELAGRIPERGTEDISFTL